ncbi:MAG: Ribonuclease [Opitutia bacterium UBA7350]|nr:MAG: Ribonuclease [Opitutae bacterium UBA7350]
MELIDLNRHEGIGANSHLIRLGDFNILVDSGLDPKMIGKDALPEHAAIAERSIDLIVLTHCHLDHLGSMPLVAARNPHAPIITSLPNTYLAPRMLRNSINVMKRQREELGNTDLPLFLHRDIALFDHQLYGQRFGRSEIHTKAKDQIEIILHPAGHVIGAAAVEFIYKHRRIVFSGDVLFEAQRTLPGAQLPGGKIDTLILETTRGAKARAPEITRVTEVERLINAISKILERGGSCLIPTFALGRMQEIFKIIYEARNFGQLPRCPVFAAGLGMDLCNYFDKIRKKTQLIDFDLKMLDRMRVKPLEINLRPGRDLPQKGIYLLSSGMMVQHTPSYKAAACLLPHPKNGLCFVGYNDPDTPGGQLLADPKAAHFYFDSLEYRAPMRASIQQFDLSGHANREELADYAVQSEARAVVLTHGDTAARHWFSEELSERMPGSRILDPNPGEVYQV